MFVSDESHAAAFDAVFRSVFGEPVAPIDEVPEGVPTVPGSRAARAASRAPTARARPGTDRASRHGRRRSRRPRLRASEEESEVEVPLAMA